MIRRPPRSTQSRSSAASDVYKRQLLYAFAGSGVFCLALMVDDFITDRIIVLFRDILVREDEVFVQTIWSEKNHAGRQDHDNRECYCKSLCPLVTHLSTTGV